MPLQSHSSRRKPPSAAGVDCHGLLRRCAPPLPRFRSFRPSTQAHALPVRLPLTAPRCTPTRAEATCHGHQGPRAAARSGQVCVRVHRCLVRVPRASAPRTEMAVSRLAAYGRRDGVTAIIDAQKPFLETSTEGFAARLIRLYCRASMPSHAAETFRDLPSRHKSTMTFNAVLTAYKGAGGFDALAVAFKEIPASHPSVVPSGLTSLRPLML
ncbi:hypothetical protein GUJ93_ZPchr0007g4712 [Zizania palustris]|uniref:Pentatricopeptide repeat-containing protein n=1 Tax=Zizania palustris TaxID=103762 RepID=A0A8J5SQG4_ZIZPA|nr:hypothetical protein GUJ93_ZPchr0007g4712 [Zizania palustris]